MKFLLTPLKLDDNAVFISCSVCVYMCACIRVCAVEAKQMCTIDLKQQRFELCGFELTPGVFSENTTVL